MILHPDSVSLHLFAWMPVLAHAPSDAMVWFGSLHLLSVPLAVLSVFLLGWPGRRKLAGIIAGVALLMSLPVLVVFPFLPALLGSGGTAGFIMLLLLVAPALSMFVLFLLKRWSKTGGGGRR